MNASVDTIERIAQKVQQLIRQRDALQRDKERLQQELGLRQQQADELRRTVQLLEDQVVALKAATNQMDEQGRKAFEKRINEFVKDIDRVIAHLQA